MIILLTMMPLNQFTKNVSIYLRDLYVMDTFDFNLYPKIKIDLLNNRLKTINLKTCF